MTGFCDGVASFTYSRSGKQLALYFAIKLGAADRQILENLRSFFGVGKLYESARTSLLYRVTHREDLLHILEHFDQYPLLSSKRQTYETWRSMVLLKSRFRKPDREALDALAASLSTRHRA